MSLKTECREISVSPALPRPVNEQQFFSELHEIYAAIADAPTEMTAAQARERCDQLFSQAFECVDYRIAGVEHLPKTSGNIIILNHHKVNPYYTLPVGFQLTLDTHFVGAKLCYDIHGKSAIRIVRQGRPTEWAHSKYFSRLGHVFVKTIESDQSEETDSEKALRRDQFFRDCSDVLTSGTDLILCPEGTSYASEDSPGEFKPGAFLMAARAPSEPLIVPVAIANFDKRLDTNALGVVVKEPFRISDKVDVTQKAQLSEFLRDYREEYKTYVDEAINLAAG